MLKKFLAGSAVLALGLLIASTASAAYDFGTTTLKIGSKGPAVKSVQTVVGATPVDGVFGKMTAAKVMAWQKANGLTADGLFGKASMAKANGGAVVVTPSKDTTTVVTGGAGDSSYDSYSTGVKSKIKDGEEDVKIAALKIEAVDSDIAVNNIKVSLKNASTLASVKPSKYIESLDIYQGSKKVGSADVSDFSKGSNSVYSKSIALSGAVVKADQKDPFFVVANAASDIDEAENNEKITVSVLSYRFTDGSGVIDTVETSDISEDVSLDLLSSDDLSVKSSSSNPDDATVTVDESDSTDDVLALVFKIDNDEDSTSDISIESLPIKLTFGENASGAALGTDWAEKVIESVTVKIDGDPYEAEYDGATTDTTSGATSGVAYYTADVDGDTSVEVGDTAEVKVYITFAEQEDNYSIGTTVKASVEDEKIEGTNEDDETVKADGSESGALLTLNTEALELSNMSWSSASGTAKSTLDFFFTIKAGSDAVEIAATDIKDNFTANASNTKTLTLISGDASGSASPFTVSDGDTANFRVRYSTVVDGAEVKVTSVKGQTVPDGKKLSPTVYLQ